MRIPPQSPVDRISGSHWSCLVNLVGELSMVAASTSFTRGFVLTTVVLLWAATGALADDAALRPESIQKFLNSHCLDCHEGSDAEGELDLTSLSGDLDAPGVLTSWIGIIDRVRAGEMPPKDADRPKQKDLSSFVTEASQWLREHQRAKWANVGRVRGRRLTNLQVERTLHDLLGIDIPLANLLPEEPRTGGFTTVADGQPMSRFQIQKHLEVVDAALDEAIRRAVSKPDEWSKELSGRELARQNPKRRCREPELINNAAVTWSGGVIFYGRLPATTARESGWYRFTVKASALKSPPDHGVWCSVRTGRCVSSAPLLSWVGSFEATKVPGEWTFETWLPKGHLLEIRPADLTLKQARFQGGQIGTGEGGPQNVPGVAIQSITMERIHQGPGNWVVRNGLFGKLKTQWSKQTKVVELISSEPKSDAKKLMAQFARRAFRRSVSEDELASYVAMVHETLDEGAPLLDALRGGYRALLCSPRFLYFHEKPGRLDGYALASRLSYFLWSTMPDHELLQVAASGKLAQPWMIRKQVERMLADERGQRFVRDLAHQWLDLNLIDFTEPDRRLYRGFDIVVQQSMLDETHTYLQTMLEEDLSVGHLIDSDFTFLNSRLARFYRIDGVKGDDVRRVALRPEHHRGGVLTQGAILKVTANGTTTSPVIRGLWVSERLLGVPIPAPPQNVPAIEPDIRGAKSIRDMLEKHRSVQSCANCHLKIDPPGYALENFNPAGQWRASYLPYWKVKDKKKVPLIDASYDLPDGRHFEDLRAFKKLILADERVLAENVAEKLITYGTGAPVSYTDRKAVDEVVEAASESGYGFQSLVTAVAMNRVFTNK